MCFCFYFVFLDIPRRPPFPLSVFLLICLLLCRDGTAAGRLGKTERGKGGKIVVATELCIKKGLNGRGHGMMPQPGRMLRRGWGRGEGGDCCPAHTPQAVRGGGRGDCRPAHSPQAGETAAPRTPRRHPIGGETAPGARFLRHCGKKM